MLIHSNRFPGLPFKHRHVLPSISMLSSLTIPSPTNHTSSESVDETVHRTSTLIEQPNWERIKQLKSLVSHMNPEASFKVIALQSSNVELGVRFFKWVCKQSAYCYELDGRIHLLSLMLSPNLFGIVHKAVVVVIKECCKHEHHVLKLMGALDDLRNIGCRLNYPCYLLARLVKLNMGLSSCSVNRRMVDDAVIHCATGIPWSTFEPNLSANGNVTDITPGVSAMWTFALKKLTFSKKQLVPLLLIPKGRNLEYLVKLVSEGKLKTVVDSKHPLSKAEDAWAKSIDGHATGKIIVEP